MVMEQIETLACCTMVLTTMTLIPFPSRKPAGGFFNVFLKERKMDFYCLHKLFITRVKLAHGK